MGAVDVTLSVACVGCGRALDPRRAGHVAIFDDRALCFCDRACREAWLAVPPTPPPPRVGAPARSAARDPDLGASEPPPSAAERGTDASPSATLAGGAEARGVSQIGTAGAVVAGTLAVALALGGSQPGVQIVRAGLACVAAALLAARALRAVRHPNDLARAALVAPPLAASVLALGASLARDPLAGDAAALAGLAAAVAAAGGFAADRLRRVQRQERARLRAALAGPGRRAVGAGARAVEASDLRPGETLLVGPDETLVADAVVTEGSVVVTPWFGAERALTRGKGDALVAGARVRWGQARATVTYVGHDRAWARLVLDPQRRADVASPLARLGRRAVEGGAALALGLALVASFSHAPAAIALAAIAAYVAVASPVAAAIVAIHVGRGVLEAQRHGVSYRSAADWEAASHASVLALSARGTLLSGEPEVVDLESLSDLPADRVLALVAGAESSASHPVAAAVARAAATRGVRPDGVRSPTTHAGLGITAIASTGEALAVGNRALMLREHVSVARAEPQLALLETEGRTALLVALGGKLVGLLGLQDALRPGARAAVQHLLDVHVEPVLLSGDARETCEAIGRALDIDHVRPELLPDERAIEIERMVDAGRVVAVVGRPGRDDDLLHAASVAVVFGAAGAPGDRAIALAADDVLDGALAIALPRRIQQEARTGFALAAVPGVLAAVAVAFGLAPLAVGPLAAALGGAAAFVHFRATDRVTPPPAAA